MWKSVLEHLIDCCYKFVVYRFPKVYFSQTQLNKGGSGRWTNDKTLRDFKKLKFIPSFLLAIAYTKSWTIRYRFQGKFKDKGFKVKEDILYTINNITLMWSISGPTVRGCSRIADCRLAMCSRPRTLASTPGTCTVPTTSTRGCLSSNST